MTITKYIEILEEYFKSQEDVTFALCLGRGKVTPLSDIDIAVFFKIGLSQEQISERQIDITCELMNLCRTNDIDVSILNMATPFLKFQVIKYGKLLKCTDRLGFCRFKAEVLGEYHDIRPMFDMYAHVAIERLKGYSYG